MSKQCVSNHLTEKYKSIRNMIQYHQSSIHELLNSQTDIADRETLNLYSNTSCYISTKFSRSLIEYHGAQIKKFENALQQLRLRSDFNEEYVVLSLQKQGFTNLDTEVNLGGDVSDHDTTCCVVM